MQRELVWTCRATVHQVGSGSFFSKLDKLAHHCFVVINDLAVSVGCFDKLANICATNDWPKVEVIPCRDLAISGDPVDNCDLKLEIQHRKSVTKTDPYEHKLLITP